MSPAVRDEQKPLATCQRVAPNRPHRACSVDRLILHY